MEPLDKKNIFLSVGDAIPFNTLSTTYVSIRIQLTVFAIVVVIHL
jgi:hypothetical protein